MITLESIVKSYQPFFENTSENEFNALMKQFGESQPSMTAYLLSISDIVDEDDSIFLLEQTLFIYKIYNITYQNFRALSLEEVEEMSGGNEEDDGYDENESEGFTDDEIEEIMEVDGDDAEETVEPELSWFISEMVMSYYDPDFEGLDLDALNSQTANMDEPDKVNYLKERTAEFVKNMSSFENPDMIEVMFFLQNIIDMMDTARIRTPLRIVD